MSGSFQFVTKKQRDPYEWYGDEPTHPTTLFSVCFFISERRSSTQMEISMLLCSRFRALFLWNLLVNLSTVASVFVPSTVHSLILAQQRKYKKKSSIGLWLLASSSDHWTKKKKKIPCKHLLRFQWFSSVTQSCPILCDSMNPSMPGLPVHHQLPEFTETHVHRVGDTIQQSHPLSSPSPPTLNLSQHQGLFKWVSSSHQVAKVLEFQPQHQSFQ